MNQTGLALVTTIFLSSLFQSVIAGGIGSVQEQPIDLAIPVLPGVNEFSASALFLRPGGSNDYAVLVSPFNANVATPILSPTWQPEGINAEFDAGLSLNFRHLFAGTGNDVNVYWGHLRTADSATFPVNRNPPPAQQMTGPFWNIGPDAGTTSAAQGSVNYHYDVFNAEVGQHINFAPKLHSRLFAGISGVWLKQTMAANFSGTDPILGSYTFGITTQSEYNAGGLRAGIEGSYESLYHVNVVGLLAGAIYIGSQRPDTSTVGRGSVLTNAGIPVNHQSINHDRYVQAVPAADAKLGLSYSHQYSSERRLKLEAGYMASLYVNAIQNYVPSTYVPGSLGIVTGSVFLQSLIKTTDSFSLDGPYVTATLSL